MYRERASFISIVIPAYNEENYIGPCLKALLEQDYPQDRYEIIVVDNASSDRTAAVAASFGVQVLYEPQKGVGGARQRGAETARGEIIVGMDADSRAPQHWLAAIDQLFRRDPQIGAATGPIYLYDGRFWERWGTHLLHNPLVQFTHFLGRGWLLGNNFAVRANVFWQIGGFNTELVSSEEVDLAFRLRAVSRLIYDPRMVMFISARRLQEGYGTVAGRALLNYIRVTLLDQPPRVWSQVDIR